MTQVDELRINELRMEWANSAALSSDKIKSISMELGISSDDFEFEMIPFTHLIKITKYRGSGSNLTELYNKIKSIGIGVIN